MTEPLMCLSLWQPYATLLAVGAKGPETRGWATKHRGRIGIAATKTERPEEAPLVALPAFHDALWPALGFDRRPMPTSVRERLPRGAIVATAELVDCVPITWAEVDYSHVPATPGLFIDDYLTTEGRRLWLNRLEHDLVVRPLQRMEQYREFGDYSPGRWAWLFEDVKPVTERCPWCWGKGGWRDGTDVGGVIVHAFGARHVQCPTCEGRGTCDPVPARGMPGLWPWTPEQVAA